MKKTSKADRAMDRLLKERASTIERLSKIKFDPVLKDRREVVQGLMEKVKSEKISLRAALTMANCKGFVAGRQFRGPLL